MYKIHADIDEVELNRVTPFAIKKYKDLIKKESQRSTENIKETIDTNLKDMVKDGNEIKSSKIIDLVTDTLMRENIDALVIYENDEFAYDWADVVFVLKDKDRVKIDFETKWYWDEFIRGFRDFFGKLNLLSNR